MQRLSGNGKDLLRFITCGSVDDGKSTLIGRLLFDSQLLSDDQLVELKRDSRNRFTGPEGVDFSLLVDGLIAEREQGITIDVAYRFFETAARRYIVADTPGHEQYTRNMVTAASRAELALLLTDARKGLLRQTRRHAQMAALMGIPRVILAVNKMDLVDFDAEVFNAISAEFSDVRFDTRVSRMFNPFQFRVCRVTTCSAAAQICLGSTDRYCSMRLTLQRPATRSAEPFACRCNT